MANTVSSMVLFGATLTATVLLTCMPATSQPTQKQGQRCRIATAPSGWPTYVDRLHGFCFRYPPTYAPVAQPWLKKYTNAPNKSALNRLRKAAQEGRMLRLQHKQDTAVSITVFLTEQPFNLESFVAGAPTGIEDPPEPKQFGVQTFYYYGPGGGGVAYPDQFFYDLKGKTLEIAFDGPYDRSKTPSQETKDNEEILLQSFRTF